MLKAGRNYGIIAYKIIGKEKKSMKKVILGVGKIALSVITIPLWFIKMFVDVGHLPDPSGAVREVIFRYSMLENVAALSLSAFAYLSMALAAGSVIVNILSPRDSIRHP